MKAKKGLSMVLAAATASCMLFAGSACAEETTVDKILEQGYITMVTDAAWAPYEYIGANGEVTGCDIDLGQAIADALGVELKIVNASFDTLSTYVNNGEADMVIAAMTITDERKLTMDFSDPYTVAQQYIIVPKDNDTVETIEDLAGYNIGTHLGTTGDFLVCDAIDLDDGVKVNYEKVQTGPDGKKIEILTGIK